MPLLRHRWLACVIVLLATGWLNAERASADKTTVNDQAPIVVGLEEKHEPSATEPAEQVSLNSGELHITTAKSAKNSLNTPTIQILSSSQWISNTIQRWLQDHSSQAFSPMALSAETFAAHMAPSTISAAPNIAVGPAEPLAPPPVHHLKVMLDWYPSPRHAALFIAQQRGLFEQHDLEVELITPADPEAPAKLLAAGRVDLALTRQPLLHLLVNEGKPLIRVASLIRLPLSFLLAERSEADGPTILEGTRIGYLDRDGKQILLPALLSSLEMNLNQIESHKVHFRAEDAIREERVDAIIGAMQYQVVETLASNGLATQSYPITEFDVPLHDGLIIIANRDRQEAQRDAIRHFVDALEEATAWIITHPEQSWTLLTSAEPQIDSRYNQQAWPEVLARLSLSPAALSQGRYTGFEQYLFDNGVIDKITPVERLAVDPSAPSRLP